MQPHRETDMEQWIKKQNELRRTVEDLADTVEEILKRLGVLEQASEREE